ncbi:uncharacterized protein N7479_003720 [Penicillium vulpinum]|uniref:uncharacterized protein n=1 Tax=Penicillium vulpinum TaxID=29845 RepID=UPI002546A257|nr:uncharacterized protein N7479_003720 [Penicillium vulpinum]KAJ5963844.1 hypothetical protein N7479_003720 [Penicillium vulpinum]
MRFSHNILNISVSTTISSTTLSSLTSSSLIATNLSPPPNPSTTAKMPRTLRSNKVYPDYTPSSGANNVTINQRYELIDENPIPKGLLSKVIDDCHLEFIDVGARSDEDPNDPERNNHAILRFTFLRELTKDTPYAPSATRGVILDLEGELAYDENTSEGVLRMRTFRYAGAHQDALRQLRLRVVSGSKLGDVINIIRDSRMILCYFDAAASTNYLTGCRDFVSQLIYQLHRNAFLNLPTGPDIPGYPGSTTVAQSFNWRYNRTIANVASPVVYAVFNPVYVHVPVPGINYTGTRRVII